MKKFIRILSLVIVVAITCTTLVGCKSQIDNDVGKKYNNMVVDQIEENGIGLKMTKLSNGSSSVISIIATIMPADATDKTLSWNLEWVERTGYSASNYNLNDYVNKVVSSNTLNCNIEMLKRFPMQIKIIVSSKSNPDVKASCLLDCYIVMNFDCHEGGAQFILNYSSDSLSTKQKYLSCSSTNSTDIVLEGMTYDSIFNKQAASFDSIIEDEIIDSYGTIKTDESYVTLIGLSENIKNLLENEDIVILADYLDFETTRVDSLLESLIKNYSSNKETILRVLNTTDIWFEIYISFTNTYDGKTVNYVDQKFNLKGFNISDYYKGVDVDNISLNITSHIF